MRVVHAFNGADGSNPLSGFVEWPAGTFYGAALAGGPRSSGSLFRLTTDGGFTVLHGFDPNAAGQPTGLALGSEGNLYGTTQFSGRVGQGSIFRMTPNGDLSTLRLLQPDLDGGQPNGPPIFGSDGLLYGINNSGGLAQGGGYGTVFKFDARAPQPAQLSIDRECASIIGSKCHLVGGNYVVSWNSANLDTCQSSGAWSGPRPPFGKVQIQSSKPGVYVYRLLCTGPGGAKSAAVSFRVL